MAVLVALAGDLLVSIVAVAVLVIPIVLVVPHYCMSLLPSSTEQTDAYGVVL